MDISRRRCHSEHLSSRSVTDLVAPHTALKRRQEQLLLQPTVFLSNLHSIASSSQSHIPVYDRELVKPAPVNHPKAHGLEASSLPQERKTITTLKNRGQVDSADQFPLIETVLASRDCARDRGKEMAETRFYEQVGRDGVLRRTSMIKSVSRDDCLLSRGANPRTGLITPDANSIAGSIDTERKHFVNDHGGARAQWTLNGDQWVTIKPQVELDTTKSSASDAQTGSCFPARRVTPLTSDNLQHLEIIEDQPAKNDPIMTTSKVAGAPFKVNNIRRKPVGSPPKFARSCGNGSSQYAPNERIAQEEKDDVDATHTIHSSAYHGGIDSFHDSARIMKQRSRGEKIPLYSFLDPAAKSKPSGTIPVRGFAARNINKDRLEQSLRTNSGPYPSPASNAIQIPTLKYEHLLKQAHRKKPSGEKLVPTREVGSGAASRPTQQNIVHRAQTPLSRKVIGKHIGHDQLKLVKRPQLHQEQYTNKKCALPYDVTSIAIDTHTFGRQEIYRSRQCVEGMPYNLLVQETPSEHKIPPSYSGAAVVKSDHVSTENARACRFAMSSRKQDFRPSLEERSLTTKEAPSSSRAAITMDGKQQSNATGTIRNFTAESEQNSRATSECHLISHPAGGDVLLNDCFEQYQLHSAEDLKLKEERDDQSLPPNHTSCCPDCCRFLDCHDSCSGHSSSGTTTDSEMASLRSMGVFDSNFATSVAAVNKALLTSRGRDKNKFVRLSATLLGGRRRGGKIPESHAKKAHLKRSLRLSPTPSQRQPTPTQRATLDPVVAARSAFLVKSKKSWSQTPVKLTKEANHLKSDKTSLVNGHDRRPAKSNEGRRVSDRPFDSNFKEKEHIEIEYGEQSRVARLDDVENTNHSSISEAQSNCANQDRKSMLSIVSSYARHSSVRWSGLNGPSIWLEWAHTLTAIARAMGATVLHTLAIVSNVVTTYQKIGRVALPAETTAADLAGGILQSILYLLVAVCAYTLSVKVCRIILAMLRILMLPVKLCAWVIG